MQSSGLWKSNHSRTSLGSFQVQVLFLQFHKLCVWPWGKINHSTSLSLSYLKWDTYLCLPGICNGKKWDKVCSYKRHSEYNKAPNKWGLLSSIMIRDSLNSLSLNPAGTGSPSAPSYPVLTLRSSAGHNLASRSHTCCHSSPPPGLQAYSLCCAWSTIQTWAFAPPVPEDRAVLGMLPPPPPKSLLHLL